MKRSANMFYKFALLIVLFFTVLQSHADGNKLMLKELSPGKFKTNFNADTVIIEIMNIACHTCQKKAPKVQEFYDLLKKKKLDKKIVLIGIACKNTDFEVGIFKKKFNLDFKIIADPDSYYDNILKSVKWPWFVVLKKIDEKIYKSVFSGQELNKTPEDFLDKILTLTSGKLKPVDSKLKVKVGDNCPEFKLPSLAGKKVSLKDYLGKKTVILSFIPAAWTPVCSGQWPAYNIIEDILKEKNAVLIGISVDNIPTLKAWTKSLGGLWFPVLSDFYPHGEFAQKLGVLRSDGTSERALFIIDKNGKIRYIDVHDINKRPPMDDLIKELDKINK